MKKGILLLLLISSVFANAQSLKEALFSGKLKNEPGTVIRKGDDLASKMDTATRKTTDETAKAKAISPALDSSAKNLTTTASTGITGLDKNDNVSASTDTIAATETATAPKDNNALWKEYIATIISTVKNEVLPSKKVKSGSYSVLIVYAIGTD